MSRGERRYLIVLLESIQEEVHENNVMLRKIVSALNAYLANHSRENEEDFGRNVLANMVSNSLDIGSRYRK